MTIATHFSNRIELLRDQCLEVLVRSLPDPLAVDYVLVDNKVMGQWLNLQLAQQRGIAANIRYIQPHELFWLLARAVVAKELPKETPLSKQEMTWKLYGLFGSEKILAQDSMKPVQHYLHGEDCRDLKRYQLAAAVADLFDQYLIYRPDMMLDWEFPGKWAKQEDGFNWQRELWVKLTESGADHLTPGLHHRAAIEKNLLAALNQQNSINIPLQRLSVFGITSMPPRLLDMLMLLGQHISVDLFVMNPCRHYWFDIKSAKTLVKQEKRLEICDDVIGNPLLASQGQQVKEFIGSLYARLDQFPFKENENYCDTKGKTLLQCIQQEILDLQYRGGVAALTTLPEAESRRPLPDEKNGVRSVQVHNCHSPLREVEVLHDQLLALFKQYHDMKPRDVVVMMPQVAPYVPYIDTVFGATASGLPYHIADRSWPEEVPLLHSLDLLLHLPESRFSLTEILALLEVPAIHTRFGIDREGFEKLKHWLRDVGVRWGLDAKHREQEGLPAYSEFSWEFAINRLLAGYGMATMDGAENSAPLLMAGDSLAVMPFDEIEGGGAALLNGFLQCWDALLRYRKELSQPASAANWAVRLNEMLDAFIAPQTDEEQLALRTIRREIGALGKAAIWHDGEIDIAVVRAVMEPALQAPAQGGHAWREGIKFCSLLPMRGVPFRVVYMLGINQSDYPKRSTQVSFDLMRNHYQPGDRSRRVDDRWLFLEALLSARDAFHVSYIGRDQRKNEERQPSVVLAELLDYVRHGYSLPEDPAGKKLMEALVIEHPLQPFSREYFVNDANRKLVSFNQQAHAIAAYTRQEKNSGTADLWPKSQRAEQFVEVSIESFLRFFTDPPRWFFNDRHKKVSLKIEDESVSDSEIFELSGGLESWTLKDALRQMANSMEPVADPEERVAQVFDALEQRWKAEGRWPLGSGGDGLRQKITKDLDVAWLDARRNIEGESVSCSGSCELVTPHGKLVLRGELACVGDTFFFHTASKSGKKHELRFAVQVAFAGLSMSAVSRGLAVFWDKQSGIANVSARENRQFLASLAGLYLQYREHGLPFEPGLSLSYTQDADKWKKAVAKAWHGDEFGSAGIVDDMASLAFYMSEQRLLHKDFSSVAETITAAKKQWESSEVKS